MYSEWESVGLSIGGQLQYNVYTCIPSFLCGWLDWFLGRLKGASYVCTYVCVSVSVCVCKCECVSF